jgi:hypothetical protein
LPDNSQIVGTFKMRRIKNRKKVEEDSKNIRLSEDPIIDETTDAEVVDVNTIEEFLELKKLQNRILEKMLENMNQSENQDKINNTKIKKK